MGYVEQTVLLVSEGDELEKLSDALVRALHDVEKIRRVDLVYIAPKGVD